MKVRVFFFLAIVFALCLTASAAHADLQEDVDRAVEIIERFQEIPEKAIPQAVLRDAKGLAIITVAKAGFVVSGRGGTGIVIARTEKGWSGPSAIGTGGTFSKGSNITLGGNLSAAIGPIGRSAEAGVTPQAAIYTYSRSQGIFAGVSLEGAVIATRYEANEQFYGKAAFPADILSGSVKPPAGAQKLLDVLSKY